jgi:hypothetical protein
MIAGAPSLSVNFEPAAAKDGSDIKDIIITAARIMLIIFFEFFITIKSF